MKWGVPKLISEIEKLLVGTSQMKKIKLEKCVVGAVIKGGNSIVGTLPLSAGRWASNQIFKKGGLTGPQLLEGGCWERGGLLGGVAIFT